MKKLVITILLIILLTTACNPAKTDDGLLILKVDEEHNGGDRAYELEAGPGFALELHGYNFKVPEYIPTVNMIQIALGEDQVYSATVDAETESLYRLTAETLSPVDKSKPFEGLNSGAMITIGVGYWREGKAFFVVWTGQATVK